MKNTITLLIATATLLGSCRSIKPSDFHSGKPMQNRLPNLGLLVHERSFLGAFHEEYLKYLLPDEEDNPWFGMEVTDHALDDVFRLMQNELDDNITDAHGKPVGNVRLKLLDYSRPWKGMGWLIPSITTLFVVNYLGMPLAVIHSELELQLEITDSKGKVLIAYTARGSGKSPQALYYGYTASDAIRRANLNALKDAMSKIKVLLSEDAPELTQKLLATR